MSADVPLSRQMGRNATVAGQRQDYVPSARRYTTMTDHDEVTLLIEAIGEAFANRPYPGDDKLCGTTNDFVCEEVEKLLRGVPWQELRLDPGYHCDLPVMLSWDAFQYYLPVFLIITIDRIEADSFGTTVKNSLTPGTGPYERLLNDRTADLSGQEAKSVLAVLEYVAARYPEFSEDDMPLALEYWRGRGCDSC